jgi:Dolichyl-phosphate-mannose-protein mannosyltransferase
MSTKPQLATPAPAEIARTRLADPAWGWALRLLAGYQALFIVWCAWVSSVFPKWVEEASVSIWPISAPLGTWLERVVLLPLVRYDVAWYLGIAQYGYGHTPGDTAFHPLYPLLMGLLGRLLGGSYLLAGWLISLACTFGMLVLLYRLVRLDYDDAVAQRTTLYLMGSPLGFAFLIPYTEPLLLLSIIASLYCARRGRWLLAGLAGAAATLTKQPGLVVLFPMLVAAAEPWRAGRVGARARILGGLALPPLGLLIWLVYRATLGDVAFNLADPSSLVGALLVTPSYRDVWGEYFSWPWVNFGFALDQLRERPYFYLIINVFLMLIMLAIALYSMARVRRWYIAFTLPLILMNLSIVYPLWPYMGIVRRFTIIVPIFIQLALAAVRRPLVGALVLVLNALLWTLIASMYVRNAFVP